MPRQDADEVFRGQVVDFGRERHHEKGADEEGGCSFKGFSEERMPAELPADQRGGGVGDDQDGERGDDDDLREEPDAECGGEQDVRGAVQTPAPRVPFVAAEEESEEPAGRVPRTPA